MIGIGTIGSAIAQLAARSGHAVALYDISQQVLQRTIIQMTKSLELSVQQGEMSYEQAARTRTLIGSTVVLEHCAEADLIIEAAPENLDVKKEIFERIDKVAPRTSVIASTTNSLPISVIAAAAKQFPERVIGMHFFPPPATVKLVEIIRGDQTTQVIVEKAVQFALSLGKETVTIRDNPGFLVNRIGDALTGEALRLVGEGHLDVETIDRLMESLDFTTPPFRQLDQTGLDTVLAYKEWLYQATYQEPRYRPHHVLRHLVLAGRLGRKSKQGFYKYSDE